MSNFFQRSITGILFVAIMLGSIWWSYWSMAVVFLLIVILGLWEFYSLLEKAGQVPQKYFGVISGAIIFASYSYLHSGVFGIQLLEQKLLLIFALVCISFFVELFRNKTYPFQNIASTILGIIYMVIPFLFLVSFSFTQGDAALTDMFTVQYHPQIILGFFFLIWSNDTFAYLVGRMIGRTKLFERISPNKTWEGTIGGMFLTMLVAYIISMYFKVLSPLNWLIVSIIVSVTGTLGDLVESMFKRSINVKDSGTILPGHGGVLDRFDAVLLASPFVCAYIMLIQ